MENQHRKIKGYRELSQEEIDMMNSIKAKGVELLALQNRLEAKLHFELERLKSKTEPDDASTEDFDELMRFVAAEPQRWAAIGKTDIQTGIMALVRAVAQPEGV